MKFLVLAAAMLLAATGCSGDDGEATDPAGPAPSTPSDALEMPTEPVLPDGPVVTGRPATVMDTGEPELCMGAVAESYPPQCDGWPLQGWSWSEHEGAYEEVAGTRWGLFEITGTWDGTTFTASSAAPAQPDLGTDEQPLMPAESLERSFLKKVAREVQGLGGAIEKPYPHDNQVHVTVTYDDGTLQDWANATYGDWVVIVEPLLVDAE